LDLFRLRSSASFVFASAFDADAVDADKEDGASRSANAFAK
jgi:hypothetical protein